MIQTYTGPAFQGDPTEDTLQTSNLVFLGICADTYISDFAFDVLQKVFLSSDEEWMLELCVISLWFQQTALLNVHHLTEPI